MIKIAHVKIWEHEVGVAAWDTDKGYASFEYYRDFLKLGLNIAPLHMGLDDARRSDAIYSFPSMNFETYRGLPGLLADALPDKYGDSIIDAWLTRQKRSHEDFTPIERLCYTGSRGMGALEFHPIEIKSMTETVSVEVANLVSLAQDVMTKRTRLDADIDGDNKQREEAIKDIIRVGTSAGGARPKAIIAVNGEGNVVSGQGKIPEGYQHYLLKFDGVNDIELGAPAGYGQIEYAYYKMALDAGITMTKSRLLQEGGRSHFLTKRFDRNGNEKTHMQSLCGIAHYDFNMAGMYSYEQAFAVMRQIGLTQAEIVQLYRRMVFNIIARNQDDHTKNISFLMNEKGKWRLSPAYDVTFSHDPKSKWVDKHQMSVMGKRSDFVRNDLIESGKTIGIKKPENIIQEVGEAVRNWDTYAKEIGIKNTRITEISDKHRKHLLK
jgi:serine/threonine-protein kinase HipA